MLTLEDKHLADSPISLKLVVVSDGVVKILSDNFLIAHQSAASVMDLVSLSIVLWVSCITLEALMKFAL